MEFYDFKRGVTFHLTNLTFQQTETKEELNVNTIKAVKPFTSPLIQEEQTTAASNASANTEQIFTTIGNYQVRKLRSRDGLVGKVAIYSKWRRGKAIHQARPFDTKDPSLFFARGGGGSGGFRGVILFSRGNERGISRCQKSIREGLWKIDCQLTATEEVVHKNIRRTRDLANVKVGGYHWKMRR